MDETGPAHERGSVTAARWALAGATTALVALASGATALLVVTSTTGAGLPFEEPHPLPGTSADGVGGSADVLLLPGGSPPSSGTRAGRAGPGSDDPLVVLRSAGTRAPARLTGLAGQDSSPGGTVASGLVPPAGGGTPEDGDVAAAVEERPQDQRPDLERPQDQRPARPTPGESTPPAEEEPEDGKPATGPGRTPAAEPRPGTPAEDDGEEADKNKKDRHKGKEEPEGDRRDPAGGGKNKDTGGTGGTAQHALAGAPAETRRAAGAGRPDGR